MAFHCYPAIALYPTADGDMGCTADKPQVGNRRKGEKTSRLFCRDSPTLHIVTQSLGYSFQRTDHKWATECNTHALTHTHPRHMVRRWWKVNVSSRYPR